MAFSPSFETFLATCISEVRDVLKYFLLAFSILLISAKVYGRFLILKPLDHPLILLIDDSHFFLPPRNIQRRQRFLTLAMHGSANNEFLRTKPVLPLDLVHLLKQFLVLSLYACYLVFVHPLFLQVVVIW